LKINKRLACFFSREGHEQMLRQQYSIQDIEILKELGFDVVIASRFTDIPWHCDLYFSWWASGSILPVIVALINRTPIVVVAGGNEVLHYRDSLSGEPGGYLAAPLYKRLATKITLSCATSVFVVSDFMKRGIRVLTQRDVRLIPNSINTEVFSPGKSPRIYITMIASTNPRVSRLKRVEIFIRAMPHVSKEFPEYQFIIIGASKPNLSVMNDLAKELNIEDRLIFTDLLANQDVVALLQQSAVYVQISDTETFGVSIAEAMSCSVPVVVSNKGAIPEVVGDLGIFVNHNDPVDVARGICSYLKLDLSQRHRIGALCRERICKNFSYQKRRDLVRTVIEGINL
jgi:glycosyltransferase involved in cell wall biosynthesis